MEQLELEILSPTILANIDLSIAEYLGKKVLPQPGGEFIAVEHQGKDILFSPTRLWRDTGFLMEKFNLWPRRWLDQFIVELPGGYQEFSTNPKLAVCNAMKYLMKLSKITA